jgi:hypothetical protein
MTKTIARSALDTTENADGATDYGDFDWVVNAYDANIEQIKLEGGLFSDLCHRTDASGENGPRSHGEGRIEFVTERYRFAGGNDAAVALMVYCGTCPKRQPSTRKCASRASGIMGVYESPSSSSTLSSPTACDSPTDKWKILCRTT